VFILLGKLNKMYKLKTKKDSEGNKYYVIKKKFWIFWFKVYEYGRYEHAKEVLDTLSKV
jgi:hypothetical protein